MKALSDTKRDVDHTNNRHNTFKEDLTEIGSPKTRTVSCNCDRAYRARQYAHVLLGSSLARLQTAEHKETNRKKDCQGQRQERMLPNATFFEVD